jgi:hypothetical protein
MTIVQMVQRLLGRPDNRPDYSHHDLDRFLAENPPGDPSETDAIMERELARLDMEEILREEQALWERMNSRPLQ